MQIVVLLLELELTNWSGILWNRKVAAFVFNTMTYLMKSVPLPFCMTAFVREPIMTLKFGNQPRTSRYNHHESLNVSHLYKICARAMNMWKELSSRAFRKQEVICLNLSQIISTGQYGWIYAPYMNWSSPHTISHHYIAIAALMCGILQLRAFRRKLALARG